MNTQVNNNSQSANYIKHDSMAPLSKFHGRIVKTFSMLPQEGKLVEIVKRIILVVIAPIAYVTLALFGVLFGGKQAQIHSQGQGTSPGGNPQYQGVDINLPGNNVGASSQANSTMGKNASQSGLNPSKTGNGSTASTGTGSTSSTGNIDISAIEKKLKEMNPLSDELKKMMYHLYETLLMVNGGKTAFSLTQWSLYIFSIKNEMIGVINKTSENIFFHSHPSLFFNIQNYWSLFPLSNKKNPGILLPSITLDPNPDLKLWIKSTKHIDQVKDLCDFKSHDEFFGKFKTLCGDKGAWFEAFEELESIYESNLKKFQKLSDSYDDFLKDLNDDDKIKQVLVSKHKLSFNEIKKDLDEHKVSFKEFLDKLKVKIDEFKLVNDVIEKIMQLAPKNSN